MDRRGKALTVIAGILGIAVIGGLVTAVIMMSSRWNTVEAPVFPPHQPLPQQTHTTHPSNTSSTRYTTSVPLSTTDIGAPGLTPQGGPGAIGGRPRTSTSEPADSDEANPSPSS